MTSHWTPLAIPATAHHAAFAAYVHDERDATLLLFWYGADFTAGHGRWTWEMIDDGMHTTGETSIFDAPPPPFAWADGILASVEVDERG